jgi:putative tryptophan/tyrosine transport system substrate-binding protein
VLLSRHARRWEFIAGLGGATLGRDGVAAEGRPIIEFLGSVSVDENSRLYVAAFLQGLKESSHVEGQNCAIEYRWAEGPLRAPAATSARRSTTV